MNMLLLLTVVLANLEVGKDFLWFSSYKMCSGEPGLQELNSCHCDEECVTYADCCYYSQHFDLSRQYEHRQDFECVQIDQDIGVLMKVSCLPEWEDTSLSEFCSDPPFYDILLSLPVTSRKSNIIYKNSYCALCNNDSQINMWQHEIEIVNKPDGILNSDVSIPLKDSVKFKRTSTIDTNTENCENLNSNNDTYPLTARTAQQCQNADCNLRRVEDAVVKEPIKYNPKLWELEVTIDNKLYLFHLKKPLLPENILDKARRCDWRMVSSCLASWRHTEMQKLCHSHMFVVYFNGISYRNPQCALCNNIRLENLTLGKGIKDSGTRSHSTILNLNNSIKEQICGCEPPEIYDIFSKQCRAIEDDLETLRFSAYKEEEPQAAVDSDSTPCLLFYPSEFKYVNGEVFVPDHNKTYPLNETVKNNNGTIFICGIGQISKDMVDKFGFSNKLITFVGFVISSFFIMLHLLFYFFSKKEKRLPKRNVASFSISLLLSFSLLLVGNRFKNKFCYIASLLTCYAFLSSFMWMLVISYDVWRTIHSGVHYRKAFKKNQLKRFILYSLCAWSLPALITALAVFVDFSESLPDWWKPHFGQNSCWFGHRNGLVIFFIIPFTITMALDVVFFVSSGITVYRSEISSPISLRSKMRQKYKLFVRLAFVTGLTWTIGLVASAFDNIILWYIFNALNSLQGVYIFIGFTIFSPEMRDVSESFMQQSKSTKNSSTDVV